MLRKGLLAAGLALGLAWAAPASADTILFSPNGTGNVGAISIDLLDWAVGNSIAVGVSASSPVGTDFNLFYQANLAVAQLSGNTVYNNGSNGTYFTAVAGFGETLATNTTVAGTGILTFTLDPTPVGGLNTFRIYAQAAPGQNIDGVCFVCGTVIMEGHVTAFISPSIFGTGGLAGNLDQNGVDNYGPGYAGSAPTGIDTISGSGSVNIRIAIDSYSQAYFPTLAAGTIIDFSATNTSTILPYQQIDPSRCFFATAGGYLANACAGGVAGLPLLNGATLASLGPVNGLTGPNTMLQSDANSSFTTVATAVPEPATLSLLGLGLVGSAIARRRKAAKK